MWIFLNWNFIWITLQSLVVWEIATEAVLERESLMAKIEDFERTASDPNRFFVKGNFEFHFCTCSIAFDFMSILIPRFYAGAHEPNGG